MDKGERKCREELWKVRKMLQEDYGAKKVSVIEDDYIEGGFYSSSCTMAIDGKKFTIHAGYSGETGVDATIEVPTSEQHVNPYNLIEGGISANWIKFLES